MDLDYEKRRYVLNDDEQVLLGRFDDGVPLPQKIDLEQRLRDVLGRVITRQEDVFTDPIVSRRSARLNQCAREISILRKAQEDLGFFEDYIKVLDEIAQILPGEAAS